MNNDAKGNNGPQFRSAPLMTSAVLVGSVPFSSSLAWPWAAHIWCRRRGGG
jgi:hypothetical protein